MSYAQYLSYCRTVLDNTVHRMLQSRSIFHLSVRSLSSSRTARKGQVSESQPGYPKRTILYGSLYERSNKEILAKYPTDLNEILTVPIFDVEKSASNVSLSNEAHTGFPFVTLLLNVSMNEKSKERLQNWKRRMIKLMGYPKFMKMMRGRRDLGTGLHKHIRDYVEKRKDIKEIGDSLSDNKQTLSLWKSVTPILKDIHQLSSSPAICEQTVCHWKLCYKGKFDAVTTYKDQLFLFEWKATKMGTFKSRAQTLDDMFDDPIQVAAYIGAFNADAKYKYKVRQAMIVSCKDNGEEATVFKMNEEVIEKYWKIWLTKLKYFWTKMTDMPLDEKVNFS